MLAHGVTGGITAELQGESFGHGFFSAGLSKLVMGQFKYKDINWGAIAGRTTVAAAVDDYLPAGHTFGTNHDAFVGLMVDQHGLPDILINIPSMLPIYIFSIDQEAINTPFRVIDSAFDTNTVPFGHFHQGEN